MLGAKIHPTAPPILNPTSQARRQPNPQVGTELAVAKCDSGPGVARQVGTESDTSQLNDSKRSSSSFASGPNSLLLIALR